MHSQVKKRVSAYVLASFIISLLPLPSFARENNVPHKIRDISTDTTSFDVKISDSILKKTNPSAKSSDRLINSVNGNLDKLTGTKNGKNPMLLGNENAPRQESLKPNALNGDGNGNGHGDDKGDGSKSIAHPLFYPMCLFVDTQAEKSKSDMDKEIKELVGMAHKCQVNLVVYPRWVDLGKAPPLSPAGKGSDRSDTINDWASSACNIKEKLGVPSASVSTCDRMEDTDAEMCNSTKDVAPDKKIWSKDVGGCAQVHAANGGGLSSNTWDKVNAQIQGGGEHQKQFSGSGAVPSIEGKGTCTGGIIAHEANGHSQMGMPNYEPPKMHNLGNGIGKPMADYSSYGTWLDNLAAEGSDFKGWEPMGCDEMRKNSFKNDGRWKYNPKKEFYMPVKKKILKIDEGEKVFKIPYLIANGENPGPNEITGDGRRGVKIPGNVRARLLTNPGSIFISTQGLAGGHPEKGVLGNNDGSEFNASEGGGPNGEAPTIPQGQIVMGKGVSNSQLSGNEDFGIEEKLRGEDPSKANSFQADFFAKVGPANPAAGAPTPSMGSSEKAGSAVSFSLRADGRKEDTNLDPRFFDRNGKPIAPQPRKRADVEDVAYSARTGDSGSGALANRPPTGGVSGDEDAARGDINLARNPGRLDQSESSTTDFFKPRQDAFSATSDPSLPGRTSEPRRPSEERRPASERREPSTRRQSSESSESAYSDSSSDFGE